METNEIRAVIKYICKKGMFPKEIYEDMVDTLREDAPSYSTVKKMECVLGHQYSNLSVLHTSERDQFPKLSFCGHTEVNVDPAGCSTSMPMCGWYKMS
ncbi:hypothetical protein LAZ67_23001778 [Cordylochernes scorpioides]|uniref:Mos1 transposase HTH domain-containing protein n=1 Tax=Cordylochernes scorpioides TaxID=51811 RepID=A0ABY6LV71_9ARAC|nr:hypothetical protein LAZ67_23001778 [Cordylochernes scorpioides]